MEVNKFEEIFLRQGDDYLNDLVRAWNEEGVLYDDMLFLTRSGMNNNEKVIKELLSRHGGYNVDQLRLIGEYYKNSDVVDAYCYYNVEEYSIDEILIKLAQYKGVENYRRYKK